MAVSRLLVANRGEIAIRLMRGASALGIPTVAVFPADDADCLHVRKANEARQLEGAGVAAYLDIEQIIRTARDAECDAIHPGYGFLSENALFARRCEEEGITFVGPRAVSLELFGDKVQARARAQRVGVPVIEGSAGSVSIDEAKSFFQALPAGQAMMIKAVGGGGGRGARAVERLEEIESAYKRCQSEALAAFGNGDLFVERYIRRARHIEVQILGDGQGGVSHLWERECSIQRRFQKLVEVAPSPGLPTGLRNRILDAAVRMAMADGYRSLGTFEFLVDADAVSDDSSFAFIEANPRLQVEHTVTEEVLGLDLVWLQLQVARGATLRELGVDQASVPTPRGFALQARVNMETMLPDGATRPSGGLLTAFDIPSGPGVRTDTFGYVGYRTSARYDSLLAKVVVHSPSHRFEDVAAKAYRALSEFRINGLVTNIPFLQSLLTHPDVVRGEMYTRFVDDHVAALTAVPHDAHARLYFDLAEVAPSGRRLAGARVDSRDPLAVLALGKATTPVPSQKRAEAHRTAQDDGHVTIEAPLQGTIVEVSVSIGDAVRVGQQLLVMEAMKMEHVIFASHSGIVRELSVAKGDTVFERHVLASIELRDVGAAGESVEEALDLDYIRPDLALIHERHAVTLDAARPDAVEKRRKTGQRTSRESIDQLCDEGSFIEHGSLVLTPATGLPMAEVIRKFPTDGMVTGVGNVNGDLFDEAHARCVVLAYDYTVLAGTQGAVNHPKTDRMLELAERWRWPVVFFAEGGGGRAGTGGRREGGSSVSDGGDAWAGRPLDTPTFATMGRLSGLVPTVGITSGRCFAGNAALLGCCDVIIATANSNIGMGGPALIEGGNLGVFTPEEVGPMDVQVPNGVVDIAVRDEVEAVEVAKKYVSYFQGAISKWECADQRILRTLIPENRLRMYDIRKVIEGLADTGSFLELRREFGLGMVTGFIRIEGRPMGVIANNPCISRGRSTATVRTRRRASCSCSTPSISPCSSSAIRQA